ncbi:ribosome assembly protein 4 [Tolypothrix sp. FACHB-123]|nr:ribosome assembly protein 4 [Tolypothrix sp. FACHB-123]
MSDNQLPEKMHDNSDRSLQQLAWAIEASVGQFKLILARCNYSNLRDRLINQLRAICRTEISILVIRESNRTLYSAISEEFSAQLPACLMVVGLDSVKDLPQMLTSANQVREEFRKHFPFPLVLWINDEVHKQLMQIAPDLESWAITRNFTISKQDLVNFVQITANKWFNDRLKLSLPSYLKLEAELTAAQKDLFADEQFNSLEIQAGIASLLGWIKQVNQQIDSAIEYYQKSLILWQRANNLERQIKILGNLALCYYLKAAKCLDINHADWRNVSHYLEQYIDLLTQTQNQNIIAESIEQLGNILRDVGIWQQFQSLAEQLKTFAQQALTIHEANNQPRELAKDYALLSEVALVQKSWQEANDFIQQALIIWSTIPNMESGLLSEQPENLVNGNDFSLYQFILALSQYHLGQIPDAISSLELAKKQLNPLKDLKLYLQILNYLQQLYFEQQEYLKAYEVKQQQRSVEQQFGLRAFIGAGRLGSTKQVVGETVQTSTLQENIAPEIAASGRQLDVERLLERIGRPDYKLIVIYGQSGVGKSSLINAGLVPALKQKAIGIQDNLPVVMRFYTNWEEELGRVLRGDEDGGIKRQGDSGILNQGELEVESSALTTQVSALIHKITSSEGETSSSGGDISSSEGETSSSEGDISSSEGETSSSEGDISSSEHETSSSEGDTLSSEGETSSFLLDNSHSQPYLSSLYSNLLAQLRDNEAKNIRTILIFDQFEEFFFTYPEPAQRREFFEFLGECFNVLSVKVILSLRIDYLHYLLECNDLPNMQIISNDILSKNVLYKLGNFSPIDAKSIIQRLTENSSFRLEPKLVDQLVKDLAREIGEVRPIELQVVGAQLQTENITTLTEYRRRGTKEQLVKHYLDEVVHDCGAENQQLADLLLYLLTDEKGTRPLRTLVELERDLQALVKENGEIRKQKNRRFKLKRRKKIAKETTLLAPELPLSQKLELVLAIFVKSGLVVLLKENPGDRYQLVHDYLAAFIRQQQEPKLKELMAELDKERTQRKLGEEKLNRLLKRALLGSIVTGLVFAGLAAGIWRWAIEAEEQRRQAEINEISSLTNSSSAFSASGQTRDAILEALKAVKRLHQLNQPPATTQMRVVGKLREAVYLQPQNKFQELQTLSAHHQEVRSVTFSSDGKLLASGSDDNTIKIWDVTTAKLLQSINESNEVNTVSFSGDGKFLASGSDDNTIKIWDVSSGKLLQIFNGHSKLVNSVSFSGDGKFLASGSDDNTIKIWDVTTGKLLRTLPSEPYANNGHNNWVTTVAFSSDGKLLASGGNDYSIKIWDVTSGKALQTFSGHGDYVSSVAFSSDGQKLASGSSDRTIKLWNLTTAKVIQTFSGHSNEVNAIAFSPDGKQIVSGSQDKTVKIWDVTSGKVLQTLGGHRDSVNSVAFSSDGKKLVSGSDDSNIKLWDVTIGKVMHTLPSAADAKNGHRIWVNAIAFSRDGKQIVSGSWDKTVKIWDVTTSKVLQTLIGHRESVNSVTFSSDSKLLASGSDDHTVKIWDATTGKVLHTLVTPADSNKNQKNQINSVAFSPDGKLLASGSSNHTIKIWDVSSGKLLRTFRGLFLYLRSGHSDAVNSVTFSPDGKQLASGSSDNTIKLWDIPTGKLLKTLALPTNSNSDYSDSINSITFSPDGKQLASASSDNTIKLWDIATAKVLQTLMGHSNWVRSVAFSADGKQLVSGSDDSTIKIWDLATGQLLKTLTSGYSDSLNSVSFSPDGKHIASASSDNKIIIWNFNLDQLVKDGCNLINNYLILHPETLAELELCQTQPLRVQAAKVLVTQGEKLAPMGDINGAVAKFRQAQQWDSNLRFDPKAKANDLANQGK